MRPLLALVLVAGCTGDVASTTPGVHMQTLPDGPCAVEGVTGTLPGVSLSVRSSSCVYVQGETATLEYEVTVDATTPTIVIPADPPGGCGTCVSGSTDPLSFLWPTIAGAAPDGTQQLYCPGYAAFGCCAPHGELRFDLDRGTFKRMVPWSGRTFDCPSDTGQSEGAFFPAGVYEARAELHGYAAGEVTASLPVELLQP